MLNHATAGIARPHPRIRAVLAGMLAYIMLNVGCAPRALLPVGAEWPRRLGPRQLFHTPQGYIYATSAEAAGWADRYLAWNLPDIAKRCKVQLDPGVVIVLARDESVRGQPTTRSYYSEYLAPHHAAIDFTGDAEDIGLPSLSEGKYAWCCSVPTDEYYRNAIDRQFDDYFRHHSGQFFLDKDPFSRFVFRCLMTPAYKSLYVRYSQSDRLHVFARTAVARSSMTNDDRRRALEVVRAVYEADRDQRYHRMQNAD